MPTTIKQKPDTLMVQRLADQLTVFKKAAAVKAHVLRRKLDELACYPEHDQRRETPEFVAVRKRLVQDKDLPCLVCGVRHSTLGDPKKNPYGARAMEAHHHVIEWSVANAIDPAKFNDILRPHLEQRHPDEPMYKQDMSADQIAGWVDHHQHNLWVLCDVHHRARFLGIHEITYPIWGPADLLRDDFEEYVREQIRAAGGTKQAKKPASRRRGRRGGKERRRGGN